MRDIQRGRGEWAQAVGTMTVGGTADLHGAGAQMAMSVRAAWARVACATMRVAVALEHGIAHHAAAAGRATLAEMLRTTGKTVDALVVVVAHTARADVVIGMTHAAAAAVLPTARCVAGDLQRATTGTLPLAGAVALVGLPVPLAPRADRNRAGDSGATMAVAHGVALACATHARRVVGGVLRLSQSRANSTSGRVWALLGVCSCLASQWHSSSSWSHGQRPNWTTRPPYRPARQPPI